MLYFLHNYEIPAIEAVLAAQGGNYLDDAVELFVDEIPVPIQPENIIPQDNSSNEGQSGSEESPVIGNVEIEDEPIDHAANNQSPIFTHSECESELVNDVCIDPGGNEAHTSIGGHGSEITGYQTSDLGNEASQPPKEANTIVGEDSLSENEAVYPHNSVKISFYNQIETGTCDDRTCSIGSLNENEDVSILRTVEGITQEPETFQLASNRFCQGIQVTATRSTTDPFPVQNQHGIASPPISEDCFDSSKETYSAGQSSEEPSERENETTITDTSIHENSNQHTGHLLRTLNITTPVDQTDKDINHIKSIKL